MEFENISLKEGIKLSKDKKHYILMRSAVPMES